LPKITLLGLFSNYCKNLPWTMSFFFVFFFLYLATSAGLAHPSPSSDDGRKLGEIHWEYEPFITNLSRAPGAGELWIPFALTVGAKPLLRDAFIRASDIYSQTSPIRSSPIWQLLAVPSPNTPPLCKIYLPYATTSTIWQTWSVPRVLYRRGSTGCRSYIES
jgi:hypothetical protein